MKRNFLIKKEDGTSAKFVCEFTKKNGFHYEYMDGESVEWKYVIGALTFCIKRCNVLISDQFVNDEFVWQENKCIDIRYIPSIISSKDGTVYKLPFMIDDREVLEDSFFMPTELAVKVALSLSMKCGILYIEPDDEKIKKNFGDSLSKMFITS